ncbi:hypothetical protein O9929_22965 [Vibrio lentus]|nr:hypothetical protein [Vibrio lentus]
MHHRLLLRLHIDVCRYRIGTVWMATSFEVYVTIVLVWRKGACHVISKNAIAAIVGSQDLLQQGCHSRLSPC